MKNKGWKITAIAFIILFIASLVLLGYVMKEYTTYYVQTGEEICWDICNEMNYTAYGFEYDIGCQCSDPIYEEQPYWILINPEGEYEIVLETP